MAEVKALNAVQITLSPIETIHFLEILRDYRVMRESFEVSKGESNRKAFDTEYDLSLHLTDSIKKATNA